MGCKVIPKLMCTQHPDSTIKVRVEEEVDEAIVGYTIYSCGEVMVDYEGKLTPYSQPKEIVVKASKAGIPVGYDFFITPRMPNPFIEEFDRAMLALEASVLANYYSSKVLGSQAVKWIILPMVEDVDVVVFVQKIIGRKAKMLSEETGVKLDAITVVPLLEDAFIQTRAHNIVYALTKEMAEAGMGDECLRVFLGFSDSAVRYGHIASALGVKYSLSKITSLSKLGLCIKPIIGSGSPPFRGGVNNTELVPLEVKTYKGYSTVTVQSAIRYDVPLNEYEFFRETVINGANVEPDAAIDEESLRLFIKESSESYRSFVGRILRGIEHVINLIPSTRDRISWRSYGRLVIDGENQVINVPRAIMYTAMWYNIGLPPTLLDSPYIVKLAKKDLLDDLLKALPQLVHEWSYDSSFYDPEISAKFIGDEGVKTVNEALEYMNVDVNPNRAYVAMLKQAQTEAHVIALGKLRKFLG
ncbi:MAG: phosphoenolpyruvate carboxylase [Desulfurococcaceae archaeon]